MPGNWVQASGAKEQNIVTPGRSSFSKRWGHALTVDMVDDEFGPGGYTDLKATGGRRAKVDRLILIGGDDYDPILGEGGYHNDVHVTYGFDFITKREIIILTWINDLAIGFFPGHHRQAPAIPLPDRHCKEGPN